MEGMTKLDIRADLDAQPWSDLPFDVTRSHTAELWSDGLVERIGLMRNGTRNGRAVVALAIRMPDGTVVVGQTTWRLFRLAATALSASAIARGEPD